MKFVNMICAENVKNANYLQNPNFFESWLFYPGRGKNFKEKVEKGNDLPNKTLTNKQK